MRYIHSEERLPILDNGERLSFFFIAGIVGVFGGFWRNPVAHNIMKEHDQRTNSRNAKRISINTSNMTTEEEKYCVGPATPEFLDANLNP
jgi:hypothetical protein